VDSGIVGENPSPDLDGCERRDNCPYTTASEFLFPVDSCLVARAIIIVKSTGDVGAKDTILNGKIFEFQGFKNDVIFHIT
jgi:hypothetical protein